jgi:hypothetical protein
VPNTPAHVQLSLLRPDDLLNLEITAVNLRLDAADPDHPVLVVDDAGESALLVVRFPAQTIFEEAFFDSSPAVPGQVLDPSDKPPAPAPGAPRPPANPGDNIKFRLGGESRLVFRVPPDVVIPYSIDGLLDWSKLELVVSPIADVPLNAEPPASALTIRPPDQTETTLQLPFRLHLSPTHDAAWQHDANLVEHAGRVELWHTRLAARDADGKPQDINDEHTIALRAIWSPDYQPGGPVPPPAQTGLPDPIPGTPAIAAMDTADRHQIVVLTSAFDGYARNVFTKFVPEPINASMLMLSPLGGWLRSFGKWEPPTKIRPRRRPGVIRIEDLIRPTDFERPAPHHGLVVGQPPVDPPPIEVRDSNALRPIERRGIAQDELEQNPGLSADLGFGAGEFTIGSAQPLLSPERFGLSLYDLDENGILDLSQWAHIAAQGRDHYVRLVYEGKLKDLGHRASLVKVTERRFEESPDGDPVAYLRQYMYIVIREPEKVYANEGLANAGRGMPLRRVRLTTLVTPHIEFPYASPSAITDRSFWVRVGGADFMFHGFAEDVAGNRVDFAKAMIFVPNSETKFADIQTTATTTANRPRLRALVPGQKVAFAERDPDGGTDNTSFVTESIDFDNEGSSRDKFFKPRIFKADVRIPAVEALTGAGTVTSIRLAQQYLDLGFVNAANRTGAFAEVVKQNGSGMLDPAGLPVGFSAQQAGGFSTPSLDITCLTRGVGPLGGDLTKALSNTFDPKQVFKAGMATLFGVFDLADLLPTGSADGRAPKMQVRHEANAVITELDWNSPVEQNLNMGIVEFQGNPDTELKVHALLRKELGSPDPGTFSLQGKLNHFQVEFLASLQIQFAAFTFESRTGSKTDVNVGLAPDNPVVFKGDLSFVEGLRSIIPPGVFGDGVSIDLIQNPLGVKAGLSIGLPPATVGVFALKNIAFSAGLTIPFLNGKPVVELGFARRDKPFLLAVMIFGGGGFFHIELDTDGMRMLEAAFEFGAAAALDIGVASGEVHIMAGIYFKMEKKKIAGHANEELASSLTGYLRCGGSLCVLGIVRISVEFYLSFTYYLSEDKAKGRATLTVEIEIACFSKSIELTVERAFGGKGGDPTFAQMIDKPELWAEYADAFA